MGEHQAFKLGVTMQAAHLTVVSGLRALSEHCQQTGNKRMPWRGTGELLDSTWSVVDPSDDDPATPQRR